MKVRLNLDYLDISAIGHYCMIREKMRDMESRIQYLKMVLEFKAQPDPKDIYAELNVDTASAEIDKIREEIKILVPEIQLVGPQVAECLFMPKGKGIRTVEQLKKYFESMLEY